MQIQQNFKRTNSEIGGWGQEDHQFKTSFKIQSSPRHSRLHDTWSQKKKKYNGAGGKAQLEGHL